MCEERYKVTITWSKADNAFLAKCPLLDGVIAHGDSRVEALHNVQHAIKEWVESAKKYGWKIPTEPDDNQITHFTCPDGDLHKLYPINSITVRQCKGWIFSHWIVTMKRENGTSVRWRRKTQKEANNVRDRLVALLMKKTNDHGKSED